MPIDEKSLLTPMIVSTESPDLVEVCVPSEWSDTEVRDFTDHAYWRSPLFGWGIRRTGDPLLRGQQTRSSCPGRAGFVHLYLYIVLDALR